MNVCHPSKLSAGACVAVLFGAILLLGGCQSVKNVFASRDNGSLDYQSSQLLAPLKLPQNQPAAPFVPLYPTPHVGSNTLQLANAQGKQYRLPKPEQSVAPAQVIPVQ